jgi:hypothetical protein
MRYHARSADRRNVMEKPIASVVMLLLSTWCVAGTAAGQAAAPARVRVDVARLGPQVGQRVPDFSLRDQAGRVRNLESIMGPRGAMLVFLRSADW